MANPSSLLWALVQLVLVQTAFGQIMQSFDTMQVAESPDSLHIVESSLLPDSSSQNETQTEAEHAPLELDERSIHYLAGHGHFGDVRKILLQRPEMVHARDQNQWTPLHEAARSGHIYVTQTLLEFGADVNARHKYGGTPLFEAEIHQGPESAVAKFLVSQGAIRVESKSKLRGFGGQEQPYLQEMTAANLVGTARIEELNHLLDIRGDELLNRQDENGWTLLHEAVRFEQLPMARFLIQRGADPDIRNKEGHTPMQMAEERLGYTSPIHRYLMQVDYNRSNGGLRGSR